MTAKSPIVARMPAVGYGALQRPPRTVAESGYFFLAHAGNEESLPF